MDTVSKQPVGPANTTDIRVGNTRDSFRPTREPALTIALHPFEVLKTFSM
jgi:hypothetical protein